MKNTLLDQVGNNLLTAKQTISNFFKQCNPPNTHEDQINFEHVLFEKHNSMDKQPPSYQQTNVTKKIQQAIRNSSVAKTVYHEKDQQKITQQCMQNSEFLKEMENQVSVNNVSRILELKKSNSNEEEKTQISGVLYKYSPSFFGGWSDRYCILSKSRFIYMEAKDKNSPIAGFINFNILSFSVRLRYSGQKVESFEIKVDEGDKNFIFKGSNTSETIQWYEKISQFIKHSEGKINNVTALSNYHRFWRKEYITQKQFEKAAQTGDIILFRGKKTSAMLQRAMTGEEFDHIGVILLNAFDQILIFEANGGFGVGICPWKKFVKNKWFQDQQIVAIRHLKIKRSEQFLNEVTKFVQSNIGKEYKFSLKNYIMARHSQVQNQKNSYFCSSLVAKLYKTLGLLDQLTSSSRYMPYDFSDKEKLQILDGKHGKAQLERERIIVFQKKPENRVS